MDRDGFEHGLDGRNEDSDGRTSSTVGRKQNADADPRAPRRSDCVLEMFSDRTRSRG